MKLTADQLDTLRHMLGINDPYARLPAPSRDYFCANPDDIELIELASIGAVEKYSERDSYWWYRCTPEGRAAAMRSHQDIRVSKSKRVYVRFLEISDAYCDLTFKEFITSPEYAESRRNA